MINLKPHSFTDKPASITLGVSPLEASIDQKRNVIELLPGYQTFVTVTPQLVDTDDAFDSFSVEARKCKFVHETDEMPLNLLNSYTRVGCEFECAAERAALLCKCMPWYYTNENYTRTPICDMFGGYCFDQIVSNIIYYKMCKVECLEDCHYTSLSMWHSTVPLEVQEICKDGTFFDIFFKKNFQRLFAFENYQMLVQKQSTLDIAKSLRNGSLCSTYVNNYVSFVSIESPTKSVTKSHRDQRKFFIDKLGTIGGTLGVSAGMSVLSMAEVVVFVYILLMGIVLDTKQLWKKVVSYRRKTVHVAKKKSVPLNHMVKVDLEDILEGQQEIQKLYVSRSMLL